MKFRSDINGLRAWAVMAVVLFHFEVIGFSGGFVGVDIFFVISGFLMTKIISSGLNSKDFNYFLFIRARILRIVPALLVLCAVTMLFGWFVLDDAGYKLLVRHIGASLIFGSNFKYWRESGYFDSESHDKLLLHTWSLSTEWQFYMLLPLLMMLVWKVFKKDRPVIFVFIFAFIISFGCSIYFSFRDPGGAFFLLHTRAWEMLAGSLVFYFSEYFKGMHSNLKPFEWLGLLFILFSIFFLKPTDVWPGYLALFPVLGASLVILAKGSGYWINNKVVQLIGSSSYSIYLWHWPLVVIMNYGESVVLEIKLLFIFLSLLVGYVSYRFLEVPVRNNLHKRRNFWLLFSFLFFCFFGLAAYSYEKVSVGWRLLESARNVYDEKNNKSFSDLKCSADAEKFDHGCKYGGGKLGLIIIGDSHAQAVVTAAKKSLPSDDMHVLEFAQPTCGTIFGVESVSGENKFCSVNKVFEDLKKYDKSIPVVIVNRLPYYFHGQNEKAYAEPEWYVRYKYQDNVSKFREEMNKAIVETACAFADYRQVYMMRPIPELKVDVLSAMGRSHAIFGESRRISISWDEYQARTSLARQAQDEAVQKCGVKLLDPTPYLCSDGRCWGDVDGKPIYVDDDHLSLRGSDLLVPEFRKIFE